MKEFNYKEFQKECEFEEYYRGFERVFIIRHIKTGIELREYTDWFGNLSTKYGAYERLFNKVYGEEE